LQLNAANNVLFAKSVFVLNRNLIHLQELIQWSVKNEFLPASAKLPSQSAASQVNIARTAPFQNAELLARLLVGAGHLNCKSSVFPYSVFEFVIYLGNYERSG